MKIWLKVIIAGIIIFLVGIFMVTNYDILTIGLYGIFVGGLGLAMIMIGARIGLKRAARRMMNE